MLTTTEVFDDDALASLVHVATLLGSDLKAGLYTNLVNPTKVLTLADLTEAAYGGYVQQSVVMGPPIRDPAMGIASLSGALLWQQTGTAIPVIIQGIFYVFGATPTLLGVEPFVRPIPLNDLLDAFSTVLEYVQSNPFPGLTTVIQ